MANYAQVLMDEYATELLNFINKLDLHPTIKLYMETLVKDALINVASRAMKDAKETAIKTIQEAIKS